MRVFDIKLTEQQLTLIGGALGQLPYAQVAPTIAAINGQIAAQLQPPAAAPTEAAAAEAAAAEGAAG